MRRRALFVVFLVQGMAMASWITRTPAIRDALSASTGQMGLILFGLSVGSMSGILMSGAAVSRFGTRPVAIAGLSLVVASMLAIGAGVVLTSKMITAVGLALIGFGMGLSEIAVNVDGADVERLSERPLLHTLHGFYSLGTVGGAIFGFGLTALDIPVVWHLMAIAIVVGAMSFAACRYLPAGIGRQDTPDITDRSDTQGWLSLIAERRLLMIALIVLGMALAEGSANDWLPILMVDSYNVSQASGSLMFVVFAAMMTVGRFGGGYFLERYGRARVIRASAISCAIGIGVAMLARDPITGSLAVVLWGLGASLGFPVTLSAAADTGKHPAARVAVVATGGYIAFLAGPPGLGFIGEHYGLRSALAVVLLAVVVAAIVAQATKSDSSR
nr:membrane protein [Novosphingobium sp. P6W]